MACYKVGNYTYKKDISVSVYAGYCNSILVDMINAPYVDEEKDPRVFFNLPSTKKILENLKKTHKKDEVLGITKFRQLLQKKGVIEKRKLDIMNDEDEDEGKEIIHSALMLFPIAISYAYWIDFKFGTWLSEKINYSVVELDKRLRSYVISSSDSYKKASRLEDIVKNNYRTIDYLKGQIKIKEEKIKELSNLTIEKLTDDKEIIEEFKKPEFDYKLGYYRVIKYNTQLREDIRDLIKRMQQSKF